MWSPREDNFRFLIVTITTNEPSKRFILSEVAKVFDPVGWLAPVIITIKLLVQELSVNGTDWDQNVNDTNRK